jgi:hypothetical protein
VERVPFLTVPPGKVTVEGVAQAKKINAEADVTVLRTVGQAEAAKTQAVGGAEAEVIKLKIEHR